MRADVRRGHTRCLDALLAPSRVHRRGRRSVRRAPLHRHRPSRELRGGGVGAGGGTHRARGPRPERVQHRARRAGTDIGGYALRVEPAREGRGRAGRERMRRGRRVRVDHRRIHHPRARRDRERPGDRAAHAPHARGGRDRPEGVHAQVGQGDCRAPREGEEAARQGNAARDFRERRRAPKGNNRVGGAPDHG